MTEKRHLALCEEAAHMYHQGNYHSCLQLLSQAIQNKPTSVLYSNRAIAHYRLNNTEQAHQDLRQSLGMDHLNYVAYFNMFSLMSLQSQQQRAYKSLCLGLSVLNTLIGRQERKLDKAQRAVYLSYNNKQALALHGLLLLEQQQYAASLQALSQACSYEPHPQLKAELKELTLAVAGMAKQEYPEDCLTNVGGTDFQLKTDLPQPQLSEYTATLKEMLREFNILYSTLQENNSAARKEYVEPNLDLSSVIHKLDEESNHMTTHTSFMNMETQAEPHAKASCLLFMDTRESLMPQHAGEPQTIPEQTSWMSEPMSPQFHLPTKHPETQRKETIYVQFIIGNLCLANPRENKTDIYAVLDYHRGQNQLYRSSLISLQQQQCEWQEVSQSFKLAPVPSLLTLRVYSKKLQIFEDELLGEGEVEVGQLGTAKVPLFTPSNTSSGTIRVGVRLAS